LVAWVEWAAWAAWVVLVPTLDLVSPEGLQVRGHCGSLCEPASGAFSAEHAGVSCVDAHLRHGRAR
jgi:hypothetical protein